MSTPSRFKKDKEIIAEYESQVKGKREGRAAAGRAPPTGRAPAAGRSPCPPLPQAAAGRARPRRRPPGSRSLLPELRGGGGGAWGGGGGRCPPTHTPSSTGLCEGPAGAGRQLRPLSAAWPRQSTFPSSTDFCNIGEGGIRKIEAWQLN